MMADTPLTLAETASVFGEMLTFRALLARETDPKRRKIMIAGKVEDMLNTVVRQIAFVTFEIRVHDERRDAWLKKHGVTVMRIPAAELNRSIDEAADAIVRLATEML